MTVGTESYRTSAVANATAGQEIPFTFPINATSELKVYKRVTTTGVETVLILDTDYTATIDGDDGGTVTLVAAIAATFTIVIFRDTAITQSLDLAQSGTFNAELLEEALDRLTRICAEMSRINSDGTPRFLRIPETDADNMDMEIPNEFDRAEAFLYFDADGLPTAVNAIDAGAVVVSPFAETLLDDANGAAMQTTLGISAFAQTLLDDAAATNVLTTLGFSTMIKAFIDETTLSGALTALGMDADIITLLDDTTLAGFRETAGINTMDEILVYDGEVLAWENNVLTWVV